MATEIEVDDASSLEEHDEVVVGEVDTSDEALNQAAEEAGTLVDEDIEENLEESEDGDVEEEENLEEEPEDNTARTKLGRKVKAQESLISEISTKLDLLINAQVDRVGTGEEAEVEDELDYDEPLTAKSLKSLLPKLLQEDKVSKTEKQATYEKGFLAEIINQGVNMEESVHDGITQVLLDKYNKIITGDPKVDAELAFLKAERDYNLAHIGSKKKSLRGKTAPNVDKPGKKGAAPKAVNMKKLDKSAQDFVDKLGLDANFVQRALGK